MTDRLIYGYFDPRDGLCHYVGMTLVGMRRVRYFSTHYHGDCGPWLKALYALRMRPLIGILQELRANAPVATVEAAEEFHVAFWRSAGHPLTNKTPGGLAGGGYGYRHSEEVKERIRQQRLGKKFTPEHREAMSRANLGKKASAETRALLSKQRKGVPKSAEHRKSMSAAATRRWLRVHDGYQYPPSNSRKQKLSTVRLSGLARLQRKAAAYVENGRRLPLWLQKLLENSDHRTAEK